MTTITSKFTKERLIDWAVVAVAERGRDLKDAPESVEAAANLKLAEIALAALTAEPVRYLNKFSGTCVTLEQQSNAADDVAVYIPLYAAPPATVVPEKLPCSVELKPGLIIGKGCKTETLLTALRRRADYYAKIDTFTPAERAEHDASIEAFKAMLSTPADSQGRPRAPVVPPAIEPDYEVIKSILPTANPDEYACCIASDMWSACRAAMLQGAEPVSNHDELAPYYLQGQKDGLEWAAQLAEANHPYTGDWLYDDPLDLAKAIRKGPDMPEFAGSSPVIPDDWVMVPKEPTQAMIKAWLSEVANWRGHVAGYKAALAAAPQHEVK
ncbi:TPA: hypothetical protein ACWOST_001092 [Salmonella enterica subsp. enterica]